ncbi:MAG: shikimate kinase [Paraburkholderia fungorum]|nr:shikimate kinase [Paraburkholderia fungorum]
MDIVCINGPINSGKSTVGRCLCELLPEAQFVEGDDHDAPEDADLDTRIGASLARIEALIINANTDLVVAYPLRAEDYARIVAAAARRGAGVFVATLSPPLAESLTNRGTRALSRAECTRIVEMYEEGYADRRFTNLLLDNAALTPIQTASAIKAALMAWRAGETR